MGQRGSPRCHEILGILGSRHSTYFLSVQGTGRWLGTWSQRQSPQLRRAGAPGEGAGDDQYESPSLEHPQFIPLTHCLMMRFGGSYTEYQSNRISAGVN